MVSVVLSLLILVAVAVIPLLVLVAMAPLQVLAVVATRLPALVDVVLLLPIFLPVALLSPVSVNVQTPRVVMARFATLAGTVSASRLRLVTAESPANPQLVSPLNSHSPPLVTSVTAETPPKTRTPLVCRYLHLSRVPATTVATGAPAGTKTLLVLSASHVPPTLVATHSSLNGTPCVRPSLFAPLRLPIPLSLVRPRLHVRPSLVPLNLPVRPSPSAPPSLKVSLR
jgi:hypothetical protein